MPPESPTRLAREAKEAIELLKQDHNNLKLLFNDLDLLSLRERIARFEERLARIEKTLEEIKQVPVLEDRVNKLEKHKDESEKRGWQFIFIGAGAACAVVGGVIVQLASTLLKK